MGTKVKVLRDFAIPYQGFYPEGSEITLYHETNKVFGVVSRELFNKLLKRGTIEIIEEEEVSNGQV